MSNAKNSSDDGRRLEKRFADLKSSKGIGKAEFARLFNLPGGASIISQHISGHRPISLDAAKAYTKGFDCSIADISPELAARLPDSSSQHFDYHGVKEFEPTYHQPATLGQTLADLSRHLEAMDMSTRRKAMALIKELVNEPESHAIVSAMIELSIHSKIQKAA